MKLIFVTATFIAVSLGVCIHAQTLNNATSTSNSMSLTATKAASDPHWTGCATRNFNILKDGKHEGKVDKTRLKTSRLSFPLDVETWFHVIHDGSEGDVSDDDVKKQVEVMNSDYNSTMLFRFK